MRNLLYFLFLGLFTGCHTIRNAPDDLSHIQLGERSGVYHSLSDTLTNQNSFLILSVNNHNSVVIKSLGRTGEQDTILFSGQFGRIAPMSGICLIDMQGSTVGKIESSDQNTIRIRLDRFAQIIHFIRVPNGLPEKYWKLVSLYTELPEKDSRISIEPHMILKSGDARANGHLGCNRFFGEYRITGANTLVFGSIATTRMACLEMQTEDLFLQALHDARIFLMKGDTLWLKNSQTLPVARFEAVYLE